MNASPDVPLRIGVALGAGSAAAMAEIGALEALTEAGVPIHCVAGTSAGAIVGAAFASGQATALRESLARLTRRGVLRLLDPGWPTQGFLRGRRGLEFIRPHIDGSIEDLALRFAAVATDLRNGDEIVLDEGPVFDAVRASIAIPGIFTPWRLGGRLLVDGGLVNPVPVSVARSLGAEFVIALNVLPLRAESKVARLMPEHLRLVREPRDGADAEALGDRLGVMEVVSQASRILAAQVAGSRLREDPPEYLLQLPVPDVGMFDVHRTAELAEVGRKCVLDALPDLRARIERAVPLHRRLRGWQRWMSGNRDT